MKKDKDNLHHMTPEEFRSAGYATIDWLVDYMSDIEKQPITPSISPGDIRASLPNHAPEKGEEFDILLKDVERIISKGLTHWQHPGFYGYFPANSSPPAILGDLISTGLGVQGMLWATSPSCTELETHVLDWLVELCGLPKQFHSSGNGGGVIQDSASSSTLCAVIAARERAGGSKFLTQMCAYISDQAHSSVEKDLLIAGISSDHIRLIETERDFSICLEKLNLAIGHDLNNGLIPFFVVGTVGTTSSGAVDDISGICDITKHTKAWVHVDAAWAGSATVCPEFQHLLNGVENVDSYVFNPHKWLLTNFDCSAFFVADSRPLTKALSIVPEYLKNSQSQKGKVIDYRDWQVPLGRRFRSLKLWFVLRSYGAEGLRSYIRGHVAAAEWLAGEIAINHKLRLVVARSLSLVCFCHVDGDHASEVLLKKLNATGQVLLTHTVLSGNYTIRVAVGGTYTSKRDLEILMKLIEKNI